MTDRRQVPFEMSEGRQPGPSGGERMLVGLAAIALLGGALIVAGNLLPKDEATSVASGSPHPNLRPSATPRPAPIELSLVPASLPPAETPASQFNGWIRANVDLPIKGNTGDLALTLGTLPAGGVAYADQQGDVGDAERGWLYIEAPEPSGWVATREAGTDLARRYVPDPVPVTGSIWNLAAGQQGFVALGQPSGRADSYPPPEVFASRDGVDWRVATEPQNPGCCWTGVAWGPAGWLLVGSVNSSRDEGQDTWVWSSPDGLRWASPGMLTSPTRRSGAPISLEASDLGYLLVTSYGFSSVWFSPDGSTWTESDPGRIGQDFLHIAATRIGFFAWTDPRQSGTGHGLSAFSPDGRTWSPVSGGPDAENAQIVPVGDHVIAMETDPPTGALRVWLGSIEGGRFAWGPMPGAVAPFADAAVTSLVSDGQRAFAFGWELGTEAPVTWVSNGGQWTREELPYAFGGIPSLAAGGDVGVVVVGHRWNTRGDNPVFWHRGAVGRWVSEQVPVLGLAPDATADECGPAPRDAVDLVNLNAASAAACFGNEAIALRTWSAGCDGCNAEPEGRYDPQWLALPTTNTLYLSPVKWPNSWWGMAVLDPALGASPDPGWIGAWLELTGHYDDPAAAACHWDPPPNQLPYYGGARSVIEGCRQQFVVTAVRVVDGP